MTTLSTLQAEAVREYKDMLRVFNIEDREPTEAEVKIESAFEKLLVEQIARAHEAGRDESAGRLENLETALVNFYYRVDGKLDDSDLDAFHDKSVAQAEAAKLADEIRGRLRPVPPDSSTS